MCSGSSNNIVVKALTLTKYFSEESVMPHKTIKICNLKSTQEQQTIQILNLK